MKSDKNRIAIVTGGGSGIGLAIAEKFVQNKITVVIIGRDQVKLETAKNKLGELCIPVAFDLDNLSSIPELINDLIKKHKKIDISHFIVTIETKRKNFLFFDCMH